MRAAEYARTPRALTAAFEAGSLAAVGGVGGAHRADTVRDMQDQAVQAPVQHRRKLSAVVRAALRPRSYRNVATMLTTCGRPVDFLSRYLSHGGR